EHLRNNTPEFAELAAFQPNLSNLSVRRPGGQTVEPFKAEYASGNYFAMFGIAPFAGRLLTPLDDSPGAPRVVVLNYHTWQYSFAGDASVVGSTININGSPYTITGIAPQRFYGDTMRSDPPDFWLPLVTEPNDWTHGDKVEWLYLIGRMKPAFKPQQVQARLT